MRPIGEDSLSGNKENKVRPKLVYHLEDRTSYLLEHSQSHLGIAYLKEGAKNPPLLEVPIEDLELWPSISIPAPGVPLPKPKHGTTV